MAFVVDMGLILKENTKANSTTRTILKTTYNSDNYASEIKSLLNKNEIPTDNLKVEKNNNVITVENDYKIESIFGKIIGIKEYEITSKLKATIKNNDIIIEEE
jgi:hypothetical protein